jgi:hypothetical protein
MELCILTKLVILLSGIAIVLDILLIEITLKGAALNLLVNVLFTCLLAFITNWACYSQGYYWIAWVIVGFTILPILVIPSLRANRDDPEVKELIEEERELREG